MIVPQKVNIILNDSPPENQFTADSDSGEEINAWVESSFYPSDTMDSNPLGVCQPPAQTVFSWQ